MGEGNRTLKLVAGNSNPELAQEISEELGIPLSAAQVDRFPDGEISVHIKETVRGADVHVIQSTSPPVNDNLMELLIIIDALKRASAHSIAAVIPYYGYARQDRKQKGRVPISAKLVANLIQTAGANRVLTIDLHVGQIQGFFDIPVDNLRVDPILADHLSGEFKGAKDAVVVSPDVNGVWRARSVAKRLGLPLAIAEKRRTFSDNSAQVVNVIGEVEGKRAVIVDDIVSTGGTLIEVVKELKRMGATEISAACTHGVFAGDVLSRLESFPIRRVMVTNTIAETASSPLIQRISIGRLFAKTIHRIYNKESVSVLFPHY